MSSLEWTVLVVCNLDCRDGCKGSAIADDDAAIFMAPLQLSFIQVTLLVDRSAISKKLCRIPLAEWNVLQAPVGTLVDDLWR